MEVGHWLILLNWKLPPPPSHVRWVREVLYKLKLEKPCYSLKGLLVSMSCDLGPFFNNTWNL